MTYSKFTIVLCFLFGSFTCFSQTHIWNGNGGDNDWFNSNNWDVISVPNASSDVQIPDNFNVSIISASAMVNTLILGLNTNVNLENDLNISNEISIPSNANILWKKGNISGGIIEIDGTLNIETFDVKNFSDIVINNRGQILITDSSQIRLLNTTTINNASSGEIIINSPGGLTEQSSFATVNNYGLIQNVSSPISGSFYMIFDMNNHGVIEVGENQSYLFLVSSQNFNNFDNGVLRGEGVFDITSTFSNTGTISPGDDGVVGSIEVINVFSLSSPGKLNIDIAGINPGEYDTIHVFGGPDLQGSIDINLTFAPIVNDEFTILTSNFTLPSCEFPSQVSTDFSGSIYTFDVICNTNSLVLKLNNVTLHTEDYDIELSAFFVAPNPVNSYSQFVIPDTFSNRDLTLNIYNYLGQKISTLNDVSKFEFQELTSGLYFAQLLDKKTILATTKFIVK